MFRPEELTDDGFLGQRLHILQPRLGYAHTALPADTGTVAQRRAVAVDKVELALVHIDHDGALGLRARVLDRLTVEFRIVWFPRSDFVKSKDNGFCSHFTKVKARISFYDESFPRWRF
jgi:hypothetical protein